MKSLLKPASAGFFVRGEKHGCLSYRLQPNDYDPSLWIAGKEIWTHPSSPSRQSTGLGGFQGAEGDH
ncbi:hypothetical protein EMIT048CA2_140074 [Pseudomonas chlororaphis]